MPGTALNGNNLEEEKIKARVFLRVQSIREAIPWFYEDFRKGRKS